MTRPLKPVELDYLPARNGQEDQTHDHGFNPSAERIESCGACAQLKNDFAWLRFHDSVRDRVADFRDLAEVLEEANVDARQKLESGDLRGFRDRELVAV